MKAFYRQMFPRQILENNNNTISKENKKQWYFNVNILHKIIIIPYAGKNND